MQELIRVYDNVTNEEIKLSVKEGYGSKIKLLHQTFNSKGIKVPSKCYMVEHEDMEFLIKKCVKLIANWGRSKNTRLLYVNPDLKRALLGEEKPEPMTKLEFFLIIAVAHILIICAFM
jgi:hypothetical protein